MSLLPRRVAEDLWLPVGVEQLETNALTVVRSTDHRSVIAGPGAGKTELLAQRAAFLLQTGRCPSPQRILAISFKRDAARNLAERVAERCHPDQAGRFDSLTFDAFAKSLLDRFGQALPDCWRPSPDYEILMLKTKDWGNYLRLVRTAPGRVGSAADIENLAAEFFERDWVVARPLPELDGAVASPGEWAAREFWRRKLKSPSSLTFPMIGRLAELIVRLNPMARLALCLTYSHVFLDEFQDTTQVQYDLMRTIFLESNAVLTAVGDNKQQIMRFALAMKDPFKAFEGDFGATRTPLANNYRSSPELVRIQHVLAQALDAKAVVPVSKRAASINGDCCVVLDFPSIKAEADYIASFIASEAKDPTMQPRDYCLLVRQLADNYAKALAPSFASYGIKLRNESGYVVPGLMLQELLTEEMSHLVILILKLAAGVDATTAWTRSLRAYLELHSVNDLTSNAREKLSCALDDFATDLAARYPKPPSTKNDAEVMVATVIDFLGEDRIVAWHPTYAQGDWFGTVKDGIAAHLFAGSAGALSWGEALSTYEGTDSVPLMTLHKSKGLEFHTVFLIGLDDDAWWSYKQDAGEATSCFFVAFSRAKQRVAFTYCPLRGARNLIAPLYRLLAKAGVKTFLMT